MIRWTAALKEELRNRWDAGEKRRHIIAHMNLTTGQLNGRIRALNLPPRGRGGVTLRTDHPAVIGARTLFPTTVRKATASDIILRPAAQYQKKLGAKVLKGAWTGMPIYSLTLEERATCPAACSMFRTCYGNNMHFAVRFTPGFALELALHREVEALSRKHRKGFVVRLHILGDFYSVDYVRDWLNLLSRHPELHVFGYSAWQPGTEIGDALNVVRAEHPKRFSVRISGSRGANGAIVVDEFSTENDVIPCPVETGKVASCGACALCWTADKAIAFKRH
jgi:hypothetical protein